MGFLTIGIGRHCGNEIDVVESVPSVLEAINETCDGKVCRGSELSMKMRNLDGNGGTVYDHERTEGRDDVQAARLSSAGQERRIKVTPLPFIEIGNYRTSSDPGGFTQPQRSFPHILQETVGYQVNAIGRVTAVIIYSPGIPIP